MQLCVRNSERHPPCWLSLGNQIIRVERGRGLACMLVCERESASRLGRWMLVLRRKDWDTHTCTHTHTRVRQRSDRLPGDGAHHRSACWLTEEVGTELCLRDELLLSSPGYLFVVMFAVVVFHHSSLLTHPSKVPHASLFHLFAFHSQLLQSG